MDARPTTIGSNKELPSEPEEHESLQARMGAFVARLHDEARRRSDRRNTVEQRWIEDLQQYHGIYDRETREKLAKSKGSKVFMNITAAKTDAMEARLWDLLFPTDDRNWSIQPTPVPELTEGAEAAMSKVDKARKKGDMAFAQGQQLMAEGNVQGAQQAEATYRAAEQEEGAAQAEADRLQEVLQEAQRRSDLMQEEIEDQLVTCLFPSQARDAIGDACRMGIGVIKGPVIGNKLKQRWEQTGNGYMLASETDTTPACYRVDPWGYFPDPDVKRPEDGEGVFERHLMSKSQLRKLGKLDGMNKDAIRDLLNEGPKTGDLPSFLTDLRDLTGQSDGDIRDTYAVWEYTGPVDTEEMETLILAHMDEKDGSDAPELDVLEEHHVRVWFCQGLLISFAYHPLDSNECMYSQFSIRPDESSPFGFGIPYIMRHPQSVLNAAWRMMMDNSGLSTGPQIVVNKQAIEPENGNWALEPRKVWVRDTSKSQPGVPAFEAFNIPSNQGEIANIIEIASQTIDEVTAQPAIAQGEQGAGITKTAQGMALLMNSANVSFRRIVKNYDDDMTTPIIRRIYHWNMQFSQKNEIKGDYDVQAVGSSVLLVREMQAQNLLMIANLFGDHPKYGPMLKHGDLLRQIFKAHMIPADQIIKTDREFKKDQEDAAQNMDPATQAEMMKAQAMEAANQLKQQELQLKSELANMEWTKRLEIAQLNYDATMAKVAEALNMKRDELDAKLADSQQKREYDDRRLAVEVAMKEATGESSGGAV